MQPTAINESSFGDPSIAWLGLDNQWMVIVGGQQNQWGLAILFKTSPDGSLVKHMLKVSLERTNQDIYTIGSYDSVKDIFTPEDGTGKGNSKRNFVTQNGKRLVQAPISEIQQLRGKQVSLANKSWTVDRLFKCLESQQHKHMLKFGSRLLISTRSRCWSQL
ncbi:hypothetical protein V6N11_032307 [Hibiscus sabdariffa]|uniref:Uncharacterized protein n=1 Tax=Hibiscus sabdariffa TaxID=183260 RepID=A0ABR2T089_9ROSI